MSFNTSLNGDLNMRVFEVLGAGGFLITDRLSPQSGVYELFEDGKHLVSYDSPKQLFDKLDYYLDRPEEAIAIARRGYERYMQLHRSGNKIEALLNFVFDGTPLPTYGLSDDPRAARTWPVGRNHLLERLPAYEFLQELHRWREAVDVLCCGAIDLCCDLADLARLRLYVLDDRRFTTAERLRLKQSGAEAQINIIHPDQARQREWDVLIAGQLPDPSLENLVRDYRCTRLIVAGLQPEKYAGVTSLMAASGYRLEKIGTPVFRLASAVGGDREPDDLVKPSTMMLCNRMGQIRSSEVSRIQGWLVPKAGETLYKLVRLHIPIPTVVELGAWKGLSTAWMASALRDRGEGRVYSVDTWKGSPNEELHRVLLSGYAEGQLLEEFKRNLGNIGLTEYVEPICANTVEAARAWPSSRKIGLLFIDASHEYEAVKKDFEAWSPHVGEGGFIVFDDVPGWPGPTRLVSELPAEYRFVYSSANNWICQKLPIALQSVATSGAAG